MGSDKSFIYVISAAHGKRFCNLRRSPIVLLIFPHIIFAWSLNFNWLLSIIPTCFWEDVPVTLPFGGWRMKLVFNLWLKITFWACLVVSRLKFLFLWVAYLLILSKSLLRLFLEVWMSCITETKGVSSEKSFALDEITSVTTLM